MFLVAQSDKKVFAKAIKVAASKERVNRVVLWRTLQRRLLSSTNIYTLEKKDPSKIELKYLIKLNTSNSVSLSLSMSIY